jgi:hypothetical protein
VEGARFLEALARHVLWVIEVADAAASFSSSSHHRFFLTGGDEGGSSLTLTADSFSL